MHLPEKLKVFQKNFSRFLKSPGNVEYFRKKLEPHQLKYF